MLLFLWRLFVVGFPARKSDCEHEYGNWYIVKAESNDFETYVHQGRICKKCGFNDFRKDKVK